MCLIFRICLVWIVHVFFESNISCTIGFGLRYVCVSRICINFQILIISTLFRQTASICRHVRCATANILKRISDQEHDESRSAICGVYVQTLTDVSQPTSHPNSICMLKSLELPNFRLSLKGIIHEAYFYSNVEEIGFI